MRGGGSGGGGAGGWGVGMLGGGGCGGGWHEEEQESNEVGRQVEGRKSVGGEEGGRGGVQVGRGALL